MILIDALLKNPQICIFQVLDSDNENQASWNVEPISASVLNESDNFYIVKAKNIHPDGSIIDCYIDISLPERISDYAYFLDRNSLKVDYHHEFKGEIICAVPIDCFGVYELFFSKTNPEIGISVLKNGLYASNRKACIAEDLGYILRDIGRFNEAAEMFQISVNEVPSSFFIYEELGNCYTRIGDFENAQKYHELFKKQSP
jgi:tetratricopeptide (TPR) repeat protein